MERALQDFRETFLKVGLDSNGKLLVCLVPGFEIPEAWGFVIADVARHASRAYSKLDHRAEDEILSEIVLKFNCEIENPTSELTASFVQ